MAKRNDKGRPLDLSHLVAASGPYPGLSQKTAATLALEQIGDERFASRDGLSGISAETLHKVPYLSGEEFRELMVWLGRESEWERIKKTIPSRAISGRDTQITWRFLCGKAVTELAREFDLTRSTITKIVDKTCRIVDPKTYVKKPVSRSGYDIKFLRNNRRKFSEALVSAFY